jgi:23S rRNA pseudouridine1911/1915/1917 synthase
MNILYEDNHCLALDKPAGLLTQGDATGERSLLDWAREYLKAQYNKPGNVYIGLVHRLDQPVSGVVLLARTSKAAARLSEQFRSGQVEKVYWAVVEGRASAEAGEWVDHLVKDPVHNKSRVAQPDEPQAREARLAYTVLERGKDKTLLELRPRTGRSHQIRVQLAARGLPICGDQKYGAGSRLLAADGRPRLALHARGLRFMHPTRREPIWVQAALPADWPGLGSGR